MKCRACGRRDLRPVGIGLGGAVEAVLFLAPLHPGSVPARRKPTGPGEEYCPLLADPVVPRVAAVPAEGRSTAPWSAHGPGCGPARSTASRKLIDSTQERSSQTPVLGFTRCSAGTCSSARAWKGSDADGPRCLRRPASGGRRRRPERERDAAGALRRGAASTTRGLGASVGGDAVGGKVVRADLPSPPVGPAAERRERELVEHRAHLWSRGRHDDAARRVASITFSLRRRQHTGEPADHGVAAP